jgi:hypothetical protein
MIKRFIERHIEPQESPEPQEPPDSPDGATLLLQLVRQYMAPPEIEMVQRALKLALETCHDVEGLRPIPPLEHALVVATILAQMHIDAIGVAAGLVFEAVDANVLSLRQVEQQLGYATARVVGSMERLNILERKKQNIADTGNSIPAVSTENKKHVFVRRYAASNRKRYAKCLWRWPKIPVLYSSNWPIDSMRCVICLSRSM